MPENEIFTRLAAPFSPADLEWRAGATNADKTRALALAYITSRAVMDRLDEVVGPANWRDEYQPGPDGGLVCGLSICLDGEWVTKWDGAENTQFEEVKGGLSSAFKRAAVKWGIGRYLYKLPDAWVACEVHGKSVTLTASPQLPDWALPLSCVGSIGNRTNKESTAVKTNPEPTPASSLPREEQILQELGFTKPSEWVPESRLNPPPSPRQVSWNAAVVEALLKAGVVPNALGAVRLLNTSPLAKDTTPETALAWARQQA